MIRRERVTLAPFTTFRIGGPSRVFVEAHTDDDIADALRYARDAGLEVFPLGAGSNVLVPDDGVDGLVLLMRADTIAFDDRSPEDSIVIADAGVRWDALVDVAAARDLWGLENLAGIPGTVGGAVVQNIGAYGAELSPHFLYADAYDATSCEPVRIDRAHAQFEYRGSAFKHRRELVIARIAFSLSRVPSPRLGYPDLARARESGAKLDTPADIASAVRAIRAGKFPDLSTLGTAGSFFMNPIVDPEQADSITRAYPNVPRFPQPDGRVKFPLAWLLDHALGLKGFAHGRARLFEQHTLVIVTEHGATAADVDALAREVAARVRDAFGISIVREVETFGARR